MKVSEHRAHDAALVAARKLRPQERADLIEARRLRDEARDKANAAGSAWDDALFARYERGERTEAAARKREALEAAKEAAVKAHEDAHRHAAVVEYEISQARDSRTRAEEARWQALVDARTLATPLPMLGDRHIRVFDSEEERDAVYASRTQ